MKIDYLIGLLVCFYFFFLGWLSGHGFDLRNLLRSKKRKGRLFEEYIVSLFIWEEYKFFRLKDWRSDKKFKNITPESNTYPDLQYKYEHGNFIYEFAIECKFRNVNKALKSRKNSEGKVYKWLYFSKYQIENYRKYQIENKIPVYLAIGLGVNPARVYELYLVPLDEMKDNGISYERLKRFYRHPEKKFYLVEASRVLK